MEQPTIRDRMAVALAASLRKHLPGPLDDDLDCGVLVDEVLAAVELLDALSAEDGTHQIHIRLSPTGWTIRHPLACRPHLLKCPYTAAAERELWAQPPNTPGVYELALRDNHNPDRGVVIGSRIKERP